MFRKQMVLAFFFLAALLLFRFISFYQTQPLYHDGDRISLTTTLQNEPVISKNGQQITVRTARGQQLFIKSDGAIQLDFGSVVKVSGIVREKQLISGRRILEMYYPKIFIEKETSNYLTALALAVRHESRTLYARFLPSVSASLLMGIVFGIKEQYPKQFLQDLQIVGVLHVIAASGMNVSFVAGAILFSLNSVLNRRYSLLIAIFMVIFYTFIVGMQPSILRASIMAIIAFTASFFGRQNLALFSLIFTGYLLIFWRPSLLFDVSFQLSFLSTIGIIFIKPVLDSGIGKLGKWGKLGGEDIATTTAAQAATLPVLLGVFGQYGMLSILVNALVLWTIPILMTLGSLAVLVGLFFEPLAHLLLFTCLPFLLFFEKTVSFFGSFRWALTLPAVSPMVWVGYYLLLSAGILFVRTYKAWKRSAV